MGILTNIFRARVSPVTEQDIIKSIHEKVTANPIHDEPSDLTPYEQAFETLKAMHIQALDKVITEAMDKGENPRYSNKVNMLINNVSYIPTKHRKILAEIATVKLVEASYMFAQQRTIQILAGENPDADKGTGTSGVMTSGTLPLASNLMQAQVEKQKLDLLQAQSKNDQARYAAMANNYQGQMAAQQGSVQQSFNNIRDILKGN